MEKKNPLKYNSEDIIQFVQEFFKERFVSLLMLLVSKTVTSKSTHQQTLWSHDFNLNDSIRGGGEIALGWGRGESTGNETFYECFFHFFYFD